MCCIIQFLCHSYKSEQNSLIVIFYDDIVTGQYGPGIALIIASYTGCNRALTLVILTVGVGLNGGIYSGFKINHLDLTPRFAGILMSITNCLANLAGLLAPLVAGVLIDNQVPSAHENFMHMNL